MEKQVVLIVQVYVKSESGWLAANYSQFYGKELEYGYLHMLGADLPTVELNTEKFHYTSGILDKSYDFRDEPYMKDSPTPIRNQDKCGASWAFSTVGKVLIK